MKMREMELLIQSDPGQAFSQKPSSRLPTQPQPTPTPGQHFNQQTQLPPQQPLPVQAQPPPQTGVQYYTQPYPAVSGTGRYSEVETCIIHTLTIPPLTPLQPQVVQTQPQMPIDFHNTHRHQHPQVRLCDQCGGYTDIYSAVLGTRTILSCTSHNLEYNGEHHTYACKYIHTHTHTHLPHPFHRPSVRRRVTK